MNFDFAAFEDRQTHDLSQHLRRTVPEFFMKPRQNKRKSEEHKRPIYDDVPYIRIRQIGDNKSVTEIPAFEEFQYVREGRSGRHLSAVEIWPEEYKRFINDEVAVQGTRLDHAGFSPAEVANLKALHVQTVEQLVEFPDNKIKALGFNGDALRSRARSYLDTTSNVADVDALRAEIAALKAQIAAPPPETAPATVEVPALLQEMDDDALRAYITDQTGETPHHFCKRPKLLEMAANAAEAARAA